MSVVINMIGTFYAFWKCHHDETLSSTAASFVMCSRNSTMAPPCSCGQVGGIHCAKADAISDDVKQICCAGLVDKQLNYGPTGSK